MDQRVTEAERTFAVRVDGEIVATARPGPGADDPRRDAPVAGVSAIGVVPGHTRRGHLGRMMRAVLDDAREHGRAGRRAMGVGGRDLRPLRLRPRDAGAALRAAARPRRAAAGRPAPGGAGAGARGGRRGGGDPPAVRPRADRRPGISSGRAPGGTAASDPEHRRDGAGPLRAAIQPGPDGEPAGYALFAAKTSWDEPGRRPRDRQGGDRREARGASRAVAPPARARAGAHAAVAPRAGARRAAAPASNDAVRPPRRRRPVHAGARRRRRAHGPQLRGASTSCSSSTTRSPREPAATGCRGAGCEPTTRPPTSPSAPRRSARSTSAAPR